MSEFQIASDRLSLVETNDNEEFLNKWKVINEKIYR